MISNQLDDAVTERLAQERKQREEAFDRANSTRTSPMNRKPSSTRPLAATLSLMAAEARRDTDLESELAAARRVIADQQAECNRLLEENRRLRGEAFDHSMSIDKGRG